jgi:hypothetical protein
MTTPPYWAILAKKSHFSKFYFFITKLLIEEPYDKKRQNMLKKSFISIIKL